MSVSAGSAAGTENAPAGRRRAALVQKGNQAFASKRVSLADVQSLSNDRSPASRAAFAVKFGADFDDLCQGETGSLAKAILELLVKDVETDVRRAVAESVAASPQLPAAVANQLARDKIEVARPVLEQSPVLDDAALEEIVRTHAMQYALAIAGRERISERLCEVLAATGEAEVAGRLVGNAGAELSNKTLLEISRDLGGHHEVRDQLIKRPALPYELVEQLVSAIGERLEWSLITERRIDGDEARRLMAAARERATLRIVARDHGDRSIERELRQRHVAGELDAEGVLTALRDGDIRSVEASMALLADIDLPKARQLLYGDDRRGLAALCLRAGFATSHYLALRMALDLAQQGVAAGSHGASYSVETIQFVQEQYENMDADKSLVEAWVEA